MRATLGSRTPSYTCTLDDDDDDDDDEGEGRSYLTIRGGRSSSSSLFASLFASSSPASGWSRGVPRSSSSSSSLPLLLRFRGGGRREAIGLRAMAVIEDLQSTTVAFEIREKHGRLWSSRHHLPKRRVGRLISGGVRTILTT